MNSSGKPTGSATPTTSTDYVIDPLNRNASEASTTSGATTTTKFTYVGFSSAVSTETLSGATTSARSYSYDASGNQLTYAVGSTRYSYMYDPHGSVSIVLNQSNVLEQTSGYTAYGSANAALTKSASGFSANLNPYQYTGKRWDTGSANYNMGARDYDPSTGRYLQEDPYYGALDNLGLAQDPLTADRYLFTGANPINFIEVDGHYFNTGCQPGQTCTPGDEGGACTNCGGGGGNSGGGSTGGGESGGGSGNEPTCSADGDYCTPTPPQSGSTTGCDVGAGCDRDLTTACDPGLGCDSSGPDSAALCALLGVCDSSMQGCDSVRCLASRSEDGPPGFADALYSWMNADGGPGEELAKSLFAQLLRKDWGGPKFTWSEFVQAVAFRNNFGRTQNTFWHPGISVEYKWEYSLSAFFVRGAAIEKKISASQGAKQTTSCQQLSALSFVAWTTFKADAGGYKYLPFGPTWSKQEGYPGCG